MENKKYYAIMVKTKYHGPSVERLFDNLIDPIQYITHTVKSTVRKWKEGEISDLFDLAIWDDKQIEAMEKIIPVLENNKDTYKTIQDYDTVLKYIKKMLNILDSEIGFQEVSVDYLNQTEGSFRLMFRPPKVRK